MKVIEKGTGQKGWSKKATCTGSGNADGGCRAVLLIEHGDLFNTFSSALGETETYTTFRCCECGVLTDINVPSSVSNNLPDFDGWKKKQRRLRKT